MKQPIGRFSALTFALLSLIQSGAQALANSLVTLDEWSPTQLVATLDGEPVDVENTGPNAWNVLLGIPTGPPIASQSILDLAGWPEPGEPTRGNFIGGLAFVDSGVLFWGLTVLSDTPASTFSLYPANGFLAGSKVRLTDAQGTERFLDVRYTDHTGTSQPVPDASPGLCMLLLAGLGLGAFGAGISRIGRVVEKAVADQDF